MRLQVDGGKTVYDGVFATEKYSTLSVCKSKVSPIMNDIPIIIDVTQGGVINRSGSLVWWLTQLPGVFKQAAWWEVEQDCYQKYKSYWDKFPGFVPRFRQSHLYEVAKEDTNFIDFLQLIWIDMISDRYVLQREVCKEMKNQIETRLCLNLGINYEEVQSSGREEELVESPLNELSEILGLDENTGEVIDQ